MGINVVVVLYEDRETLAQFKARYDLTYLMLSDPGSVVIRKLGLFNESYEEGSKYYGVPWPGVLLVDADGIVRGKFAEESYRDRPLFEDLLNAARSLSEPDAAD